MCPFCEEVYDDNAEYVDVGVGNVQVTGNYCENPECGAWELGAQAFPDNHEAKSGWVRPKYKPTFKQLTKETEDFFNELLAEEFRSAVEATERKVWEKT
jgi:hypothetical protein